MGKLISIGKTCVDKKKGNTTLEELLSRAHKLSNNINEGEDLDLRKKFEIRFNDILLKNKMISSTNFLCAIYIANLLSKIGYSVPKSWYATDYLINGIENDEQVPFKEGADVCFILYSLYPERCERRSMKKADYVKMGIALYFYYYNMTRKEVVYHMGTSFEPMAEITRECVESL